MTERATDPALDIAVDAVLLERFRAAGICFSYDRAEVGQGRGWLSRQSTIRITGPVRLEGPSALYAGPYAPSPWTPPGGLCTLGAASYSHSPLPGGLKVGRYCSIGRGLRFIDFAHPLDWASTSVAFFRPEGAPYLSPIYDALDLQIADDGSTFQPRPFDPHIRRDYPVIGDDVWIGDQVTLSMGINIGTGAVLATGAIVTSDVAPYTIVGGVPARTIRRRFDDDVVSRLLESRWWDYCFTSLAGTNWTEPSVFADQVLTLREDGQLTPWAPATVILGPETPTI